MQQIQDYDSDPFTGGLWLVELRGERNVLGELFENFSFQELRKEKYPTFFLEQVYGHVFLRSQTFDRLTIPREVQYEGERLLSLMNGILKLQAPGRPNDFIDVGDVFVEESYSRMREPVFSSYPEHVSPHKSSPLESAKLVEISSIDTCAENLFQLYGSRDPVWQTLLTIMEIITPDIQAIDDMEGLPSKAKLDHFRITGQRQGHGDNQGARFHKYQNDVWKTPMPLIEARLIVHLMLERWVNWKLNHKLLEMALSVGE